MKQLADKMHAPLFDAETPDDALSIDDPMYAVALLKVVMKLKKRDTQEFDEILDDVVSDLGLKADHFRLFVNRNLHVLIEHARTHDY